MKKRTLFAIAALITIGGMSSCTKETIVAPVVVPATTLTISKNLRYDTDGGITISTGYFNTGYIIKNVQAGAINLSTNGKDVMLDRLPWTTIVGSNYAGSNKLIGLVHLYDLSGDELDYEPLSVTPDGIGTVVFVKLAFLIQKQVTSFTYTIDILVPANTYQNTLIQPSITRNNCDNIVAYTADDNVRLKSNQIVSTYQGSYFSITWQY